MSPSESIDSLEFDSQRQQQAIALVGRVEALENQLAEAQKRTSLFDKIIAGIKGALQALRIDGKLLVEVTDTEAVLVRKAGDAGDVFTVDTVNSTVKIGTSTAVSSILDEDAMGSDSAVALSTQQSIKKYIDDNLASLFYRKIITWLQIFDEEITDFDAVTPVWDGEVDEVADFDATVDIDGDMTDAPGMGHDGGNALEFEFDNDTVACGVINADAVDQTSGVISFWFNRNDLALEDGKNIHLVRVLDGGANTSYQIRLLNTGGVYSITLNTRLDDGTIPTNVTFSPLDTNWHKITVMFSRSSGAGNNDGFSYLYVDDIYIGGEEGIDNDTKDWDVARIGVGFTSSTAFGGSFYMDTIKVDPVGAPMLDTLAAQNGTYGLSIPIMDTTARYCSFTDPTAETAITAECNLDPNTITMGAAESFTFISGDAADFTVNLKYSGGYKINAVAALDAGTDVTSDYDITDAPHKIRVVWVASSIAAADDGYLKLYIDDVLQETLSGLDNDTLDIGSVYFGAYTGLDAGTYGIFYMDDCRWSDEVFE